MTIEIETPFGVTTSSGVRELTYKSNTHLWFVPSEARPFIRVRGAAIPIDLPGGERIYALLKGANGDVDYAGRIPGIAVERFWSDRSWAGKGWKVELYPTHPVIPILRRYSTVPMLILFDKAHDAKSLRILRQDDDGWLIPSKARLKRVVIEGTDEPATVEVPAKLPFRTPSELSMEWTNSLPTHDMRRTISFSDFVRKGN